MPFDMDENVLVTIPIRYDDLPHAEFGTPQKLGEYSKTRNKPLVPGRENARYLYEAALDNEAKLKFDLNIGFDTFEIKEEKKLEVLLEWVVSQAPEKDSLKKVLHGADIACRRGLLTRIAATPYNSKDSWEFAAARVEDVIFLCEGEHYRKMKFMTPREQLMTYWGFKFEQYMTVKERNGIPRTDEAVTCRDEFAAVVCSTLTTKFGLPLTLVYSGEVDAINAEKDIVELKTQRYSLNETFWRYKSLSWWLQSSLLGIRDIVVGYRDDMGIVAKVDVVHTDDLRKRVGLEWSSNVCMNLLSDVLCTVRTLLKHDGRACVVRYAQGDGKITVYRAAFESEEMVELKTHPYAQKHHFAKDFSCYLQSFPVVIADTYVGYHNDDGLVTKVEHVPTWTLRFSKDGRNASVNPCMHLLSNVLNSIRSALQNDGEACKVRYREGGSEFTMHSASLAEVDFFKNTNFREYFNML